MTVTVRRVRADEWERVRDLRLESLRDPVAAIAFLETYDASLARPDGFWRERAAGGAAGARVAQFVAEADGGAWVGTVTVLVRRAGDVDHHGVTATDDRADLVGVYVAPSGRGSGTIDALIEAAAAWVRGIGLTELWLDVHRDNARARAVYARCGFEETGRAFTSVIGAEVEMRRRLD